MANIYKLIDISEDLLYVKGKFEEKLEGIKPLIINTDFDDIKIAFLLAINVEYVAAVRKEITES